MRNSRSHRLIVTGLGIVTLLSSLGHAQPIIPSTNDELSRRIASVADLLEVEDWDRAIDVLESVHIVGDEYVVRVDDRLLLNATEYSRYLFTQLPPPAIDRYRERFENRAAELWQRSEATGDSAHLESILREAFLTRIAEQAIDRLAEQALQAGQFSRAWGLWLMLIPAEQPEALLIRYPDPEIPREQVLAKLLVCRILSGDLESARWELDAYQELYPDAEGRLAGRQGTWGKLLKELYSSSLKEKSIVESNPSSLPTDIGVPYWSLPREASVLTSHQNGLSFHPTIWKNLVLWNTGSAILGHDVETGLGAWMTEAPQNMESWRIQGRLYPTRVDPFDFRPDRPVYGQLGTSLSIVDGRLYARLGGPITGYAPGETRVQPSRLICLDLAERQGQLVWDFDAGQLDRNLRFEGPPVVEQDQLWILARRGLTPSELHLVCLSPKDGRFLWNRLICSNSAAVPEGSNYASGLQLAKEGDRLFVSTELGAIAAFHAEDGRPAWYRTYNRQLENLDADPDSQLSSPLLIHQGRLFASPTDSANLLSLEIMTGETLWSVDRDPEQQVLGLSGQRLILSGQGLSARELEAGTRLWQFQSRSPEMQNQGRGIVTEESIWWPTPTELLIFDPDNGRLQKRVDLLNLRGIQGGNLASSSHGLIIAGPNHLTSLSPWSRAIVTPRD